MKPRVEQATEKFKSGYNCCQAIICTYCDLVDISEEEAFRISSSVSKELLKNLDQEDSKN